MWMLEALAPLSIRQQQQVQSFGIGDRFELPEAQAMRLLQRASNKVRRLTNDAVPFTAAHWLIAFREVAAITTDISAHDIRFVPLMSLIDQCEAEYMQQDWPRFQRTAKLTQQVAMLPIGTRVQWRSMAEVKTGSVGCLVYDDRGHVWVGGKSGMVRLELLMTAEGSRP
jgi:hypothetical protein